MAVVASRRYCLFAVVMVRFGRLWGGLGDEGVGDVR